MHTSLCCLSVAVAVAAMLLGGCTAPPDEARPTRTSGDVASGERLIPAASMADESNGGRSVASGRLERGEPLTLEDCREIAFLNSYEVRGAGHAELRGRRDH